MSSRPKQPARIVPISQLDRCGKRWTIAAELDIARFIFDMPEPLMHTIGCVRIDMIDFTVDPGSDGKEVDDLLGKFTIAPKFRRGLVALLFHAVKFDQPALLRFHRLRLAKLHARLRQQRP